MSLCTTLSGCNTFRNGILFRAALFCRATVFVRCAFELFCFQVIHVMPSARSVTYVLPCQFYRYKGKQNISIFPINSRKILLYSKVRENITFSASLSTDILFVSSYLSLCNTLSERDKLSGCTTFSERNTFSTTLSILTHNGRRLGVRAGEHKSSNGRQTFKFPQNFPRAYTPTDAKPLVSVAQLDYKHSKSQ